MVPISGLLVQWFWRVILWRVINIDIPLLTSNNTVFDDNSFFFTFSIQSVSTIMTIWLIIWCTRNIIHHSSTEMGSIQKWIIWFGFLNNYRMGCWKWSVKWGKQNRSEIEEYDSVETNSDRKQLFWKGASVWVEWIEGTGECCDWTEKFQNWW